MTTIKDIYSYAGMDKCAEKKCRAGLENSFNVYCGEMLRNNIMEKGKPTMRMCDCIITDSLEEKISLVELKAKRGHKKILEGRGKAGDINHTRGQLNGGLIVLRRMLERIAKSEVRVQLVLYTKAKISDRSEQQKLRCPLDNGPRKLGISLAICGEKIPADHVFVRVQDLEMRT